MPWKGKTELGREGADRLVLDQPGPDRVPGARRPSVGQPRQERSPLAPATHHTLTASASAADFLVPHPRALASSPGPTQHAARALAIGRSSEGRSSEPRAASLLAVRAVAQRHSAPPPWLRQDWRCAKAGAVRASGPFMGPQLLSLWVISARLR